MPRTKIVEFANRAVEEVTEDMAPEVKDRITADSRQAEEHFEQWDALISHVKLVHRLASRLRKRLEDHANDHPEADPPPTDAGQRLTHIRAQAEALKARYGPIIAEVTEWANGLQQFDFANAGGIPIFAAVRGVNEAMTRALRAGPPPEPPLDINNYASVQARLSYLHDLNEEMQRCAMLPGAFGNAIVHLADVLEQASARTMGRSIDNTSMWCETPPPPPLRGVPEFGKAPKPRERRYAFLTR
jgi:hypothetical protein